MLRLCMKILGIGGPAPLVQGWVSPLKTSVSAPMLAEPPK